MNAINETTAKETGWTGRRDRRTFLRGMLGAGAAGAALRPRALFAAPSEKGGAEAWHYGVHHYSILPLVKSEEVGVVDFPEYARDHVGVSAIEIAEEFSGALLSDRGALRRFRANARKASIKVNALLCANEFKLDAPEENDRLAAARHYAKWAKVIQSVSGRYLRLRASTEGALDAQLKNAASGISALCDMLPEGGPRPLVENTGGPSRNPEWMLELVEKVGRERIGLLADFANFDGDLYGGMAKLAPRVESVCAKAWDFDEEGHETKIDYGRMVAILEKAGFEGCVSIEYLGERLGSAEGVKSAIALVEKSRGAI